MRKLTADKPIFALDLETTGLDRANDRIIELSIVWYAPVFDGYAYQDNELLDSQTAIEQLTQRFNPGIPIPKAASDVHGILDADVTDQPPFPEMAAEIVHLLSNCYLTGFNLIGYDIPMLTAEMRRAGIATWPDDNNVNIIDSHLIFKKREPRTLSKAVEYYLDRNHEGAHGAYADALASLQILHAQVNLYDDLPTSMPELIAAVHGKDPTWVDCQGKLVWQDMEGSMRPVFAMGKVKGLSLQEVVKTNRGYISWILKSDFESDLKQICTDALRNKFPTKK